MYGLNYRSYDWQALALKSILGIVFLMTPGTVSSQQLPKVFVSIASRSLSAIEYFIAQDKGYFRDEGLDVTLVQIRSSVAVAATLAGEADVLDSIPTAIGAIQRGAPIKVLAVSFVRPLFWLVARPEYKSVSELKGKVTGVPSIGGANHTALRHLLRKGGLHSESDVITIVAGDSPSQLQALVSNSIQAAALSLPFVIIARDKFKMNVLGSATEDYVSIQGGVAVAEKTLRDRYKQIRGVMRGWTKAKRFFNDQPETTVDVIMKLLAVDRRMAIETYKLSKPAYTAEGVVKKEEAQEYLARDAERLRLNTVAPVSMVFDFSTQEDINRELREASKARQ
jgi:NitT/TauT family transport system substrate-binding protein